MAKNYLVLTDKQIASLLQATEDKFDKRLVQVCLFHGLRNQETVTLQRRHIKTGETGVVIERDNTKSEAGVRDVPTPRPFEDKFLAWVESQTDEPEDYLFPAKRGSGHISTRYFQKLMRDLAFEIGLYPEGVSLENVSDKVPEHRRLRPHALRHTYGTKLFRGDVDPVRIAALLGHESVETTRNMYLHVSNERNRKEVNRVWR